MFRREATGCKAATLMVNSCSKFNFSSFYCCMPNLSPLDAGMMLATTTATTGGTVGMTASLRGCFSSWRHLDTTSPHSGIELAHP
jgi:hypothetical protein